MWLATVGLGLSASSATRVLSGVCGWRNGEAIELRGEATDGGLSGPFRRLVDTGAGRWREAEDLKVVAKAKGYDGRLAWSQDVSGASHDLDSGFARALARSQAWLATHESCLLPAQAAASRVVEAGHPFAVRRFIPPGGAPLELWYDLLSGRLDRVVMQDVESRLVRHYADWRDLGGGRFVAFSRRDEDPEDESEVVYRIEAARIVAMPAAARFVRPPPPHDVRIVGRAASTTVPYEDDGRTRIYLPVYLNGQGPFTFELDDGGHFIASPQTASAIGLHAEGDFHNTGSGVEITNAGYGRVREVRIGAAVISDQAVKVRPMSAAANDRGARSPRAGVLGVELFERFTVQIDRGARTVTLTPRGGAYPKPSGRALPIVFAEDAPLTAGAFQGVAGDFMLDIGNAGATIIEQAWAEPRGLAAAFAKGLKVGDAVLARGAVSIGPFRRPEELVSYYGHVERGSEATQAVAGVLGEPLLSRFDATYDLDRKTLWLSPAPDVDVRPFNRAGLFVVKTPAGGFAVTAITPGSPAAEAGMTPQMTVLAVDGRPAKGLARSDISAVLEQSSGTLVQLSVRGPDGTVHEVALRLRDIL